MSMKVVTLLPAATEIVAAVAPDTLVGISHECDYPAWVTSLPRVTRTSVDVGASSKEIDAQVRALSAEGRPVIWVDAHTLEALKPDIIITQSLCEVCAVADGHVVRAAVHLSTRPAVISLAAKTLEGIFEDIKQVGRSAGRPEEAEEVLAGMKYKLAQLRRRAPLRNLPERSEGPTVPRVVVVEWLDPLFLAGHWVPELVAAAGGDDVGAKPGDHSHPRPWSDLLELKPEIIVVALCGFSVGRARQEWESQLPADARQVLSQLGINNRTSAQPPDRDRPTAGPPGRLQFIDGNQYTSRPGPRVVEGFFALAIPASPLIPGV